MVLDPYVLALIQDPISLAVVGGLASGCIDPFVSHAIEHGISWVSDRYKGHPKEAIKTAQNNAVNFFGQVNICIEGQQQINGIKDRTKQALTDPDYTSLFQEAVLGAARTSSEQTHKLLARLVTDRLTAEPDSLHILAAHMACNAVPQLSPTHLRLLGAIYIIHFLPAPSSMKDLSPEEREVACPKWFLDEMSKVIPIGPVTKLDFAHLVAVSCIAYIPPAPNLAEMPLGGPSYPREWRLPSIILDKFSSQGYMSSMTSTQIECGPIGS
jgi:hypothetical protein